jgi:uncharacterized coiled-coil protein SlyX
MLEDTIELLGDLQAIITEMEEERSYSEHIKGINAGFTEYEQTLFERLQEKLDDMIDTLTVMSGTR